MKRTIRNGCFETNSSSMHSIVVKTGEGDHNIEVRDWWKDSVNLYGSEIEFGRSPFEILHTFYDKVRYAVASYNRDEDKIAEIERIFYEKTGCTLDISREKEYEFKIADTGERVSSYKVQWIDKPDEPNYEIPILIDELNLPVEDTTELEWREIDVIAGWGIDHQSANLLQGFLKEKKISLEEFLTNSKYMVVVDGDEYCEFESIIRSGIVDTSKIDYIYPPHGSYDYYLWRKEHEEDD